MKKFVWSVLSVLLIVSCHGKQSKEVARTTFENSENIIYAQGFSIKNGANFQEVIVYVPWKGDEILAKYYLVKEDTVEVPADGEKLRIPLENLAVSSVSNLEFLNLLNEIPAINGMCNPNLVYNQQVLSRINKGEITDLGDNLAINVEKTLLLKPKALMMSSYNQSDANAQRIQQAGIPILYNNEWTETSLLGRAEWIKYVSVFFDKQAEADSIFKEIESRYKKIKLQASKIEHKPKVMLGSNFRGTWYMPAGNSFMGELMRDAGADYFYQNDTTAGSLPLNVETVLKNFSDTDYWLNCNYITMNELIMSDTKHRLFRPVKENNVYNFNKRMLPSTANDFWESAVARPDILLADVISILHPEILPEHELYYASKLKP